MVGSLQKDSLGFRVHEIYAQVLIRKHQAIQTSVLVISDQTIECTFRLKDLISVPPCIGIGFFMCVGQRGIQEALGFQTLPAESEAGLDVRAPALETPDVKVEIVHV